MLYWIFIILVAAHFLFLALGIWQRRGGPILLALIALIESMAVAGSGVLVPYTPIPGGEVNATETLKLAAVQDPITTYILLPWLFVDFMVYGWITRWGMYVKQRGWF